MRSIDFGWQFNVVQASDLAVYFAGLDPTRWHAAVAAPPDCSVRYLEPRTPAATVAATVCAKARLETFWLFTSPAAFYVVPESISFTRCIVSESVLHTL